MERREGGGGGAMSTTSEGDHPRIIWTKDVSFHPVVLKKKIFKDYLFYNQSEPIAGMDIEQGNYTHLWKKSFKEYHIQVWSKLLQWFLRR